VKQALAKIVKPEGAKSFAGRSGTHIAIVVVLVREVLPETPWWALLLVGFAVVALEQVFRPSQTALPRADQP